MHNAVRDALLTISYVKGCEGVWFIFWRCYKMLYKTLNPLLLSCKWFPICSVSTKRMYAVLMDAWWQTRQAHETVLSLIKLTKHAVTLTKAIGQWNVKKAAKTGAWCLIWWVFTWLKMQKGIKAFCKVEENNCCHEPRVAHLSPGGKAASGDVPERQ